MKKKVQFQFLICLAFLITINKNGLAQGVGNHITLSMQNGIEISGHAFQFDLMAVSDGDTASDLRANAFQFGINFDTLIFNAGDSITTTYLNGTSDFIPPLGAFNFPAAVSKNHIRVVQSAYVGSNTNNRMTIGHQYRVGTFLMQCSFGWVNGSNPNFSLQDSVIGGKTVCSAALWLGNSTGTTAFSTLGSGDGQRGLVVNVHVTLTSVGEIAPESLIKIYPNPSNSKFNIWLNKSIGEGELTIFNSIGQNIYSGMLKPEVLWPVTLHEPAGTYLIQVKNGKTTYNQKLIIE